MPSFLEKLGQVAERFSAAQLQLMVARQPFDESRAREATHHPRLPRATAMRARAPRSWLLPLLLLACLAVGARADGAEVENARVEGWPVQRGRA